MMLSLEFFTFSHCGGQYVHVEWKIAGLTSHESHFMLVAIGLGQRSFHRWWLENVKSKMYFRKNLNNSFGLITMQTVRNGWYMLFSLIGLKSSTNLFWKGMEAWFFFCYWRVTLSISRETRCQKFRMLLHASWLLLQQAIFSHAMQA